MNPQTKLFLSAGLMPVLPIVGLVNLPEVPPYLLEFFVCVGVTGFSLAGLSALNEWLTRKVKAKPVRVEIRPNLLAVDGVELHIPFSGDAHLFKNRESMQLVVNEVVDHLINRQRSWIQLRPSADVLVLPQPLLLSEIEADALADLLNAEFVEPTVRASRGAVSAEPADMALCGANG
ncbi:hypothetical protein LNN35_20725 [Pseudomonas stutzeri]|jgi:hypothetical protein|uniref:Uncharacterized protein n=1 Tax=Stutzerimonas stutzeri TaxID=316 RepID=A0AA40RUH7_STUST|nr:MULTISPECIES: hypothetical protein [Pseudomonadaceae]MBA1306142.1 hypothetical protein [Stutzerimonas stutzeri]MBS9726434.1 hypothetical protein [Stutzerimonas stutzeri]MCC8345190.1 hypothetical protein [Stutzerimonas stutzeri]QYG43801.1 hypothetical protein J5V74_30490 [Pseudomonas aeruginosa]